MIRFITYILGLSCFTSSHLFSQIEEKENLAIIDFFNETYASDRIYWVKDSIFFDRISPKHKHIKKYTGKYKCNSRSVLIDLKSITTVPNDSVKTTEIYFDVIWPCFGHISYYSGETFILNYNKAGRIYQIVNTSQSENRTIFESMEK